MRRQSKGYEIDMCNGTLANKILLFALPLMASSLLQLLFNAADVVVVGQFCGKASLAAVGSNTALINLLVNLFVGLSVGANVVVAQDLGAGRKAEANRAVHTSILLAMISGVVLMIFGVIMARQMLEWMSSPENVIGLASVYLRIYFIGMPATMVYNFGSAILRAKGDTQRPLYFLLAAGVLNVVLNLFFVIVCRLDVAGVAMATSISQYVSAWLILRCLMREHGALHLNLHRMHLNKRVIGRIFQVGLPAGFQGVIFSLSNVVIQSSINSFGDTVMAGSAAAQNIEGFVYAAMNAFYQSALTFSGQNYGAGKCDRVDKVALYCQGFVILTGLILGNLAFFFGSQLLGIYAPGGAGRDPAGAGADVLYRPAVRHLWYYGYHGGHPKRDRLFYRAHGGLPAGLLCAAPAVGLVRVPPGPGSREPVYLLSHHLGNHRSGPHHHVPGDPEKGVRQGTGERSLLSVCGWTPSGSDGAVKRKSGWGLCAEISAASACLKRKKSTNRKLFWRHDRLN